MFTQIVSRHYDIARSLHRKAMGAVRLQRRGHRFALAIHQERTNCFNRSKAHSSRRARGEDTKDQLFPQSFVRTVTPNFAKLIETRANFFSARAVSCANVGYGDWLAVSFQWIVNTAILGLWLEGVNGIAETLYTRPYVSWCYKL